MRVYSAAQLGIFTRDTVIQHFFVFLSKEQGCSHPLIAVSLVYDECFLLRLCALPILCTYTLLVKLQKVNLHRC